MIKNNKNTSGLGSKWLEKYSKNELSSIFHFQLKINQEDEAKNSNLEVLDNP